MKFALALLMFVGINAHAEIRDVLNCNMGSVNDPNSLELAKKADGTSVAFISDEKTDEDHLPAEYRLNADLDKNIALGVSYTFVGKNDSTAKTKDGGLSSAVLIRIADGLKSGYISYKGTVYSLICYPKK